jgi:hypothetical protein
MVTGRAILLLVLEFLISLFLIQVKVASHPPRHIRERGLRGRIKIPFSVPPKDLFKGL